MGEVPAGCLDQILSYFDEDDEEESEHVADPFDQLAQQTAHMNALTSNMTNPNWQYGVQVAPQSRSLPATPTVNGRRGW